MKISGCHNICVIFIVYIFKVKCYDQINYISICVAVLVIFPISGWSSVEISSSKSYLDQPHFRQPEVYTLDSWAVYFQGEKVEGASTLSFLDLGGGYAKDSWSVFYRGYKVEEASAQSFQYVGKGYGKDDFNTFFRGQIVDDYFPSDGHQRGSYTKDSWTVWFKGRKVEGAACSSFVDLGDGYGKDSWTVYYLGRKIDGATSMSFQCLGQGYAKDPWTVYYRGQKVEGASATTFRVPKR